MMMPKRILEAARDENCPLLSRAISLYLPRQPRVWVERREAQTTSTFISPLQSEHMRLIFL